MPVPSAVHSIRISANGKTFCVGHGSQGYWARKLCSQRIEWEARLIFLLVIDLTGAEGQKQIVLTVENRGDP